MTRCIAVPEPAYRARDLRGLAPREGTDYHPSDHAIGRGQISAARVLVLAAAMLAVAMPLLGSGIGGLERLVAGSPASDLVAHPGPDVSPCARDRADRSVRRRTGEAAHVVVFLSRHGWMIGSGIIPGRGESA